MKFSFSTKTVVATVASVFLIFYVIGVWWSFEPSEFDIRSEVTQDATASNVTPVVGYTTTTSLIRVIETMFNKPGGYLSNDTCDQSKSIN